MNPTYKFRAECLTDALNLLKRLHLNTFVSFIKIEKVEGVPDVVCEVGCPLMLDDIREIMGREEDGHVMLETVQQSENYTGERDFKL